MICDETILDKKRCNGAPDFVIEILSPSNAKHDRQRKLNIYINAGVRECWIVDPESKNVSVYINDKEQISLGYYENDEAIPVHVLEGCEITLKDVFKSLL